MALWNPSNQSATLAGWYKADAINEAARTSDGDALASWVDSSGNGNTLTQSTLGAKPSYQTNEVNSLPIVRFDKDASPGDNLFLADLGGDFEPGTGDFYIAMVAKFPSSGTQFVMSKAASGVEGLNVFFSGSTLIFRPQTVGTTTNNIQQTSVVDSSFHTIVCRRVSSKLGSEYDGSAFSTDDGTKVNNGDLNNDANFNIGSTSTGGLDTDMDLAEAFIAVGTLNDADLQRTSGYLSHKYGLVSSLPATHAYKQFPPTESLEISGTSGDIEGGLTQSISSELTTVRI